MEHGKEESNAEGNPRSRTGLTASTFLRARDEEGGTPLGHTRLAEGITPTQPRIIISGSEDLLLLSTPQQMHSPRYGDSRPNVVTGLVPHTLGLDPAADTELAALLALPEAPNLPNRLPGMPAPGHMDLMEMVHHEMAKGAPWPSHPGHQKEALDQSALQLVPHDATGSQSQPPLAQVSRGKDQAGETYNETRGLSPGREFQQAVQQRRLRQRLRETSQSLVLPGADPQSRGTPIGLESGLLLAHSQAVSAEGPQDLGRTEWAGLQGYEDRPLLAGWRSRIGEGGALRHSRSQPSSSRTTSSSSSGGGATAGMSMSGASMPPFRSISSSVGPAGRPVAGGSRSELLLADPSPGAQDLVHSEHSRALPLHVGRSESVLTRMATGGEGLGELGLERPGQEEQRGAEELAPGVGLPSLADTEGLEQHRWIVQQHRQRAVLEQQEKIQQIILLRQQRPQQQQEQEEQEEQQEQHIQLPPSIEGYQHQGASRVTNTLQQELEGMLPAFEKTPQAGEALPQSTPFVTSSSWPARGLRFQSETALHDTSAGLVPIELLRQQQDLLWPRSSPARTRIDSELTVPELGFKMPERVHTRVGASGVSGGGSQQQKAQRRRHRSPGAQRALQQEEIQALMHWQRSDLSQHERGIQHRATGVRFEGLRGAAPHTQSLTEPVSFSPEQRPGHRFPGQASWRHSWPTVLRPQLGKPLPGSASLQVQPGQVEGEGHWQPSFPSLPSVQAQAQPQGQRGESMQSTSIPALTNPAHIGSQDQAGLTGLLPRRTRLLQLPSIALRTQHHSHPSSPLPRSSPHGHTTATPGTGPDARAGVGARVRIESMEGGQWGGGAGSSGGGGDSVGQQSQEVQEGAVDPSTLSLEAQLEQLRPGGASSSSVLEAPALAEALRRALRQEKPEDKQ